MSSPHIRFMQSYSEGDVARFNGTCARTSGSRPNPCTLLADFFRTEGQVANFADRLSLTKDERSLLHFLVRNKNSQFNSRRAKPDLLRDVEDLNSLKMYEHKIVGDQWPPGSAMKSREQVCLTVCMSASTSVCVSTFFLSLGLSLNLSVLYMRQSFSVSQCDHPAVPCSGFCPGPDPHVARPKAHARCEAPLGPYPPTPPQPLSEFYHF